MPDSVKTLDEYLSIDQGLENYGSNEYPLYKSSDIGKLIGLSDIRTSTKNYTKEQKVLFKAVDTNGRQQYQYFLTIEGFSRLLASTRKPIAVKICKICGINLFGIKIVCKETNFILQIKRAFRGEIIIEQFSAGMYKIDLYFPDRKIGIEFDEAFHSQNIKDDSNRDCVIKTILGCKIIRVKEHDDIFDTINRIINC